MNNLNEFLALSDKIVKEINECDNRYSKNLILSIKNDFVKLKTYNLSDNIRYSKIKENHIAMIINKIRQLNKNQIEKKNQEFNIFKKKIRLLKPDASDEDIKMLSKDFEYFFKEIILSDSENYKINKIYLESKDKQDDIKQLEFNIIELHQMFLDFGFLIEQNSELLDNIQLNIIQTDEKITEAVDNIGIAVTLEKRFKRKQLFMILIVIFILFLLGIVIYLFIKN